MAFDPTKPVRSRNGKSARIIATGAHVYRPIVAFLSGQDGNEFPVLVQTNGRMFDSEESPFDLVNIPQKRSGWVNVYSTEGGAGFRFGEIAHKTRDEAKCYSAPSDWLACIFIEFEEGEGL